MREHRLEVADVFHTHQQEFLGKRTAETVWTEV